MNLIVKTLNTLIFLIAFSSCYANSEHEHASMLLFQTDDPEKQNRVFQILKKEYEAGSAYSAGKLGWAYQLGLGVGQNQEEANRLYLYAANNGMTYWQYLLAHAYEMGYLGFEQSISKKEYWLSFKDKRHQAKYECWVNRFYEMDLYPENEELEKNMVKPAVIDYFEIPIAVIRLNLIDGFFIGIKKG